MIHRGKEQILDRSGSVLAPIVPGWDTHPIRPSGSDTNRPAYSGVVEIGVVKTE